MKRGQLGEQARGSEEGVTEPGANGETSEPIGHGCLTEAVTLTAHPRTVHVAEAMDPNPEATAQRADTLSPAAEAFWDLLEQAGYTVWRD